MSTMRAKFGVTKVEEVTNGDTKTGEKLLMSAVCPDKFDKDGLSEDSSFSKWSPSGSFEIYTTNPALWGKFAVGQKYYMDFTLAS